VAAPTLKIDLHTHILPKALPDLGERYGCGGFVRLEHRAPGSARMTIDGALFREVSETLWSPERRLEECDRHGVDVQVLSTVPVMFSYWSRPEDGLDLARLLNDHIAVVAAARPRRFVGLGTLPMQAPDMATRELERCVRDLGLAGAEIGSHVNQWNLDRPEVFAVSEAAQDLGAALFVHPWEMMGSERMPKYWLPWLVGMPAEVALAISSLIFGGVLERLPRLKLAFAHGGGAFPWTLGRIERGFEVRPDLCAVDNRVPPRSYLGRLVFDSLLHDAEALRYLLRLAGPESIALGSDYPFPLGEEVPGRLIESITELTPEARDSLLAGTALRFLGRDRRSLGR